MRRCTGSACCEATVLCAYGDGVGFPLDHLRAGQDHHGKAQLGRVGKDGIPVFVLQDDLRACTLASHLHCNHALLRIAEGLGHACGSGADEGPSGDDCTGVVVQCCGIALGPTAFFCSVQANLTFMQKRKRTYVFRYCFTST